MTGDWNFFENYLKQTRLTRVFSVRTLGNIYLLACHPCIDVFLASFWVSSLKIYELSSLCLKEKNDDHEGALTAMENVLVWGDRVLLPIIKQDRSAVSPGVCFGYPTWCRYVDAAITNVHGVYVFTKTVEILVRALVEGHRQFNKYIPSCRASVR